MISIDFYALFHFYKIRSVRQKHRSEPNSINGHGHKLGLGSWTLAGANSYTGITNVNGGILEIGSGGSLANNGGAISVNNGAEFRLTGNDVFGIYNSTTNPAITLNAGSKLTTNSSFSAINNLTLNGGSVELNGGLNPGFGALGLKGTVTATLNLAAGTKMVTAGFSDATGTLSVLTGATPSILDLGSATGTLSVLTGATPSILDLGSNAAGSQLSFASVGTWTGILNVWNYTGAPWVSGTDKLIFLADSGNIDLSKVQFYSDAGLTTIGTGGGGILGNELVPVPEPSNVLAASLLLGVLGFRERRFFGRRR